VRLGKVLTDLAAVRVPKQRDSMLFLANLDVDVEVLFFGLALRIDNGLARVKHAVVVHIIQVIVASVVTWIKMGWISTALSRLRSDCLSRSFLTAALLIFRFFGLQSSPDVFRRFIIGFLWFQVFVESTTKDRFRGAGVVDLVNLRLECECFRVTLQLDIIDRAIIGLPSMFIEPMLIQLLKFGAISLRGCFAENTWRKSEPFFFSLFLFLLLLPLFLSKFVLLAFLYQVIGMIFIRLFLD